MKNQPYELYELPYIRDLKDMTEQKKKQMPYKIAFSFPEGRKNIINKTYADFCLDVNALGTWEFKCGFKETHIAIIGENSYEWLLLFFSIVNGGNVAVPIDKELPANEVHKLLKEADVTVVFCSENYMNLFDEVDNIVVYSISKVKDYIAMGMDYINEGNKEFIDFLPDVKKMCCIFFTSGTSGNSKGVMLSQENIAADINGGCRLFSLEGNTIALLPFHHAFGLVVGVLMVFNYGHSIYINKSLKYIAKDLQIAKPQTLFLVPLFVENFHRQIWSTAKKQGREKLLKKMIRLSDCLMKVGIDIRRKCFSSVMESFGGNLQYIISGGAGIGIQYIQEFRTFGVEILNGYGTTECSPCVAVNRNFHHKDGTVGTPLPNTDIRISDEGEVLIKGSIVMMGYYKDEEATSNVLRDGWYYSGDLGFIDKDGMLTLTGRKKNLIILSNGENISPEELENDFLADAAVCEVLVYEDNDMIVSEIFPEEDYVGNEAYFDNLKRKVNSSRPMYKQVRKVILRNTEFPKNSSRKILRNNLKG
jgi:long-chain acyl-CoA synthetase